MTTDFKPRIDASAELRARIEHALHIRTAPRGTRTAELELLVKRHGARLWAEMKKRPSIGVAVAAGAGLALAMAIGVGELTIALAVGYGAFQVLREGVPPAKAAENVVKEISKL